MKPRRVDGLGASDLEAEPGRRSPARCERLARTAGASGAKMQRIMRGSIRIRCCGVRTGAWRYVCDSGEAFLRAAVAPFAQEDDAFAVL